jgi:hypothetical protein
LSLVFSLLTVVLIAGVGDRRAAGMRWLATLPILFPLILLGGLAIIPADWWEAAGGAARQLVSLSNREAIWRAVLGELRAFQPVHLVGFGAYGQVASGLSAAYAPYFSAYVYASLASAHNAFLQTVLEIGYLGAGITESIMILALGRLICPSGPGPSRPGSSMLVALIAFVALAGCVESSWSPEYQEIQAMLLYALPGAAIDAWPDRAGVRRQAAESGGA